MWEAESGLRSGNPHETPERSEGEGVGQSEETRAAAIATAQTILTAADITLPTGDLAQGAYDLMGNYYPLPEYIVADPLNISLVECRSSTHRHSGVGDTKGDLTAGEESYDDQDFECEDEAERRREEKGKAVLDIRDQVQVKARLSEGSQDVTISMGQFENVRSLARRIKEEAGVSSPILHHISSPPLCCLTY